MVQHPNQNQKNKEKSKPHHTNSLQASHIAPTVEFLENLDGSMMRI
jgi:hypothetical protein